MKVLDKMLKTLLLYISTYYIKILLMDFTRESKTNFICASEKMEESVTQKEEKLAFSYSILVGLEREMYKSP